MPLRVRRAHPAVRHFPRCVRPSLAVEPVPYNKIWGRVDRAAVEHRRRAVSLGRQALERVAKAPKGERSGEGTGA